MPRIKSVILFSPLHLLEMSKLWLQMLKSGKDNVKTMQEQPQDTDIFQFCSHAEHVLLMQPSSE